MLNLIKTKEQIAKMRQSGKIAALILTEIKKAAKVGVTTADLNYLAEKLIKKFGVEPAFKGYEGFPAVLCTSLNDVVVHGVPSDVPLAEGDVLGLDFGVVYDGWYSDLAETVIIGEDSSRTKQDAERVRGSHEAKRLVKVTKKALKLGIKKAKAGNTTGDIGNTIERYIKSEGFEVVKELVGHGIGRNLHEEPQVPNYGKRGKGIKLEPGMTIAIEPMVIAGSADIKLHSDRFGYTSKHKYLTAHFEHTLAIGEYGAEILTVV